MKGTRFFRTSALIAATLALGACGTVVPSSRSSSGTEASRSSRPVASTPQVVAPRPGDAACMADLNAAGARFSAVPDRYDGPGCNMLGTVQLSALRGDASQFSVSNIGPLQCRTAQVFNDWVRFGADRAARQILGSPVARVETFGSYSCRNIAGSSRRSAHATAGAIDVAAFVLEDGRRISIKDGWNGGSDKEREFLRIVHTSACKRFGTVLGPEYNRAHEDHLHLEQGGSSFCR